MSKREQDALIKPREEVVLAYIYNTEENPELDTAIRALELIYEMDMLNSEEEARARRNLLDSLRATKEHHDVQA